MEAMDFSGIWNTYFKSIFFFPSIHRFISADPKLASRQLETKTEPENEGTEISGLEAEEIDV